MKRPTPSQKERKMRQEDFIVSKTDTKGRILYGNKIFVEFSGYTWDELRLQPHNIIRHPDMPRAVFKLLWDTIQAKKEIFAFVKNLSKDGGYYWVFTHVTPDFDERGNITGYLSVRRKPNESAIATVDGLYKQMVNAEKTGGVEASVKILMSVLEEKGVSYDELIALLQG